MMVDRNRLRVGRQVVYRPTDAEATTGGGQDGDEWAAWITAVNSDDTANLHVLEADGTTIAKTDVERGVKKGTFSPLSPDAV